MEKDKDIKCIASRGNEPGMSGETLKRAGLTPIERAQKRKHVDTIAEMRNKAKKSI